MTAGPPRRSPFPFDCTLAGTGLMLGAKDKVGKLAARRPPDLSGVAPTDFGYSALPPYEEKILSIDNLSGGYGLRMQNGAHVQASYYALGTDTSVPGIVMNGPDVSTVTPSTADSSTGVTRFFEIGSTLFALNGRYCHKRTSDADWNTSRKDFGAGKAATDVAHFFTNAASGADLAYIAMGDSEPIYKFDGTTYTQHAEATKIYARALAVVGREFYRAHSTNKVAKVDTNADPFIEANWTAAEQFFVGDKVSAITRMAVTAAGTLVMFKTDGVYSLDASGNDIRYFPFLRFAPNSANGEPVGAWLNDLYVTYGEGTFRISPDFVITEVGPERLTGNQSAVKGRITALQGHDQFCLYGALYNPDTGDSYLLKMVRGDVWHGSITAVFTGKKITCLYQSVIGAASGHSRMYIGFSDGSVGWFALPCTFNPIACSSYRFTTADSYLYYPTLNFLFTADAKSIKSFTLSNLNFTGSAYAQIDYRTDPTASFTALGSSFTTAVRQKIEAPNNTSGTLLDVRLTLTNTVNTTSPQLTGIGIHHALRPELQRVWDLLIFIEDNQVKRNGTVFRIGADQIKSVVETAAAVAGSVTLVLPDESSQQVSVRYEGEVMAWNERRRQFQSAIAVTAAQFKTNQVYGSYGRLEPYNYTSLGSYLYGQLEGL